MTNGGNDPPRSAAAAPAALGFSRPHLRALTGIRFVAALHVVIFHCPSWREWDSPLARNVVGSGFVAVGFFFILSGFILTYTYCGDEPPSRIDCKAFYAGRIARLYPVYAVGLLLMAPFFIEPYLQRGAFAALGASAFSVLTLLQAHVPRRALYWNPPAWSLSAEAFFYLAFPLIAPRLMHCKRGAAIAAGGLSWCVSMTAGMLYLATRPDGVAATSETSGLWLELLRFHPLMRLPEFVVGIVLGRMFLDGRMRSAFERGAVWLSIAAPLAVLVPLGLSERIPFVLLHNGLLAPVFVILIPALAIGRGPVCALLGTPLLTRLGEASYALYIIHIPIFILTRKTAAAALGEDFVATPLFMIAFLFSAVMGSLICFQYIEVPLRGRVRRLLLPAVRPATTSDAPGPRFSSDRVEVIRDQSAPAREAGGVPATL